MPLICSLVKIRSAENAIIRKSFPTASREVYISMFFLQENEENAIIFTTYFETFV